MVRSGLLPTAVCLGAALLPGSGAAQLAPPTPTAPRLVTTDSAPGVSPFAAQRWSTVGVTVHNPTDRPVELLSTHSFTGNPGLQFGRQLWVPPRAVRTSWYPILPPDEPERKAVNPYHVQSLLIDRSGGREVTLANPQGTKVHAGLLPAAMDKDPVTGVIADPDEEYADLPAVVARIALYQAPRVVRLHGDLPATRESLQGLDQLIVCSDQPTADAAGLEAIRHWLHGGGRLWIMLHRVSPATAALLLGEDFPCTLVDRVDLTRWRFRQERRMVVADEEAGLAVPESHAIPVGQAAVPMEGEVTTFEPPVVLARVVAPGLRPVHSIDGWPVSFWRQSGRGKVLFTTLGPRGWVKLRAADDKESRNPRNPAAPYKESEPLRQLAMHFFKPYDRPALPAQALAPFISEQIGYRILARGPIVAVLGAFCLGLLAVAGWLGRAGQLPHLAWVGPSGALAAALFLVAAGLLSRHAVPSMVAEVQMVEASSGIEDAPVTGMIAIYNQDESAASLGAEDGGIFLPDPKGKVGAIHRMVWTDLDRWHEEQLTLGAGLHLAPFEKTIRLDRPLAAHATFGPDGAAGTFDLGPFRNPRDALLALPSRRNLGVRVTDGAFAAGPADRLARGQFLASGILTEEQRRRQEVYQLLLSQSTWPRFPMRPTLLTWADPLDLGFRFAQGVQRVGSALVGIPVVLDRPAPGTTVRILAPFLMYQSVPLGGALSALYDPKNGTWVEHMTTPARTMLRFQVPVELLPLEVERATLTLDVSAQARQVEVFGPEPQLKALWSEYSPVRRVPVPIDQPDLLKPDADGGLYFGVSIGAAEKLPGETRASSEWRIDDLQLEVVGRVPGP